MTKELQRFLSKPSITRLAYLQRGGPVEGSTETSYEWDDPEELQLFITGATREDRERFVTGTSETIAYKTAVAGEHNVTEGDRLWFEDGRPDRGSIAGVPATLNSYRVGVPQAESKDGEYFAWYPLTEDMRGEGAGSDGSNNESDVWIG